ncbi:MAG: replication protein [Oscillospiraceae bacterium]|nr:replication protein [Oscillospiraceae bacterium]
MPQSRKWQLTINNPAEKGITHEVLKESLSKFAGMLYWCMCDETGSEGTYHTHVYFVLRTPTVHTVVENRFPSIHRENVKGTSQQNRDYVRKDGEKYNKSPDGSYSYIDGSGKTHIGTNHTDTFEEWGEMPVERQGKSKDVEKIYTLIKDGATNLEIIDAVPSGMMNIDKIERTRSILRDTHFANSWRELHVTYIFGTTGVGKTRSVMDKYGYQNCYRVTDYRHPFDTYDGQDVLILEEYRSQFKIADILNYLDGYPLLLPCRYFNRQACYSKVFIISNLPLEKQYTNVIQESRAAFFRRIHQVREYQNGSVLEYDSISKYMTRPSFVPMESAEVPPWENNE